VLVMGGDEVNTGLTEIYDRAARHIQPAGYLVKILLQSFFLKVEHALPIAGHADQFHVNSSSYL
jgi:hypothetical protein